VSGEGSSGDGRSAREEKKRESGRKGKVGDSSPQNLNEHRSKDEGLQAPESQLVRRVGARGAACDYARAGF